MNKVIANKIKYIGEVMSNYDHTIDEEREERLRQGNCIGDYPASNFFGRLWFDGENFQCEVKQYRQVVGILVAPTLEEIMKEASDKWGHD